MVNLHFLSSLGTQKCNFEVFCQVQKHKNCSFIYFVKCENANALLKLEPKICSKIFDIFSEKRTPLNK